MAVRTHLALLRGVNVGGRNRVSMAALRELVASLGHEEVATYVQSGNVAFAAGDPAAPSADLADAFHGAIAARLGVDAPVVVLRGEELRAVVRDNPFPDVADPKTLHAVFLREPPDAAGSTAVVAALARAREKGCHDDVRVVGRALYLWTPGGFAHSTLRVELGRGGRLVTPMAEGTARNWATVGALHGFMGG